MIGLYVIWNVFAGAVGAMDARIHMWRGSDIGLDKWIHTFYWVVRFVVWSGLAWVIWEYPVQDKVHGLTAIVFFACACALSFPFFHSGMQFQFGRWMNKRLDYHWFSKSKTTNANINLGPIARTVYFLISLIAMSYFL
jgi:hypothetical protein